MTVRPVTVQLDLLAAWGAVCSLPACSLPACSLPACSLPACSLPACSLEARSLEACRLEGYWLEGYKAGRLQACSLDLEACSLEAVAFQPVAFQPVLWPQAAVNVKLNFIAAQLRHGPLFSSVHSSLVGRSAEPYQKRMRHNIHEKLKSFQKMQ